MNNLGSSGKYGGREGSPATASQIFIAARGIHNTASGTPHHRYKMFTGLETDHVLSLATNNRGALTAE